MKKTNDVLSKGEAARRLQRSPATISAYLAAGMPCRSDGRLSWKTTQAWVKRNVASERSGRFAHDERKRAGQAEGPGETLTELQREKLRIENQNRALDLAHRRGTLAPIETLRLEFGKVVVELWNRLLLLPGSLGDELGASDSLGCTRILDRAIREILHRVRDFATDSARRYAEAAGASIPVAPAQSVLLPPPGPELPKYLDYAPASVENVPIEKRHGSVEWRATHPSIDDQRAFEMMAARRRWNREMFELLRRRGEWDADAAPMAPALDTEPSAPAAPEPAPAPPEALQ